MSPPWCKVSAWWCCSGPHSSSPPAFERWCRRCWSQSVTPEGGRNNDITHTGEYISLISSVCVFGFYKRKIFIFIYIYKLKYNTGGSIVTWQRWFKDVCRFRIWENLLDTGSTNTHSYAPPRWMLCVTQDGMSGEGRIFVLAFKFDVSQVFRKIVKSYFQPLVELFGKFSDNLSQTVWVREIKKKEKEKNDQTQRTDWHK